ncbi:MAG: hypothetical protein HYX75_19515 [Acidobacteria bacterium]|nr:hypothetical protein [Acidobacteriota bacterium]
MLFGRSKLGTLLFGSALVAGTAVLVAKNERVRKKVLRTANTVDRVLRETIAKVAARRRPRPPAGAPRA